MSIELIKNSPPGTKLDDSVINEKLELVSKNIDRISHQVNDVLGFVKDRQMTKRSFKISSCLYEAIESISVPNNIKIKMPKSDISILADPFQLQVLFNNLIMNAIQAIGKKKGEILIRFSEKNSELMVEVENSGPPIPVEILPHIFESLVTTKQIGTGLGLVSCKTIIENHQGTISARNDPTVLTITIPKQKN